MQNPVPDAPLNRSRLDRFLDHIEAVGNRLPHPTILFIWLSLGVLGVSALGSVLGWSATHPLTGEIVRVENLLSANGLRRILAGAVTNFTGFAPLGIVLVAMLGIGIAERSGLIATLLQKLVLAAPPQLLTTTIFFVCIMSSLGADAGVVVLPPLTAMVYLAAGRNPLAGLVAAYVGVAAGYSANLLIGPFDALLAGLSTEGVRLVDPAYEVNVAGNWWFIIASTFLITLVCATINDHITQPRMGPALPPAANGADEPDAARPGGDARTAPTAAARSRGLRVAGIVILCILALLALGLVPGNGVLRDPATGGILKSPFMDGLVVIITATAALCGIAYGFAAGTLRSGAEVVHAMEEAMRGMSLYLVLVFFAAQFVAWFAWTNLGVVSAVRGAELLRSLDIGVLPLLLVFVVVTALINLLMGSASAKWAIMAPIFVPMFYLLGITPEATQMAYRIGDSVTNVITPLIPYLALVVAIAQRYDPRVGIGSMIAAMVPYSIALLVTWSGLLAVWVLLDLPLGPGTPILLPD